MTYDHYCCPSLAYDHYEEGYDLPDKEYLDWLHQYHPDSVLDHTTIFMESNSSDHMHASQMGSGSDHTSVMGSSSDHTSVMGNTKKSQLFR